MSRAPRTIDTKASVDDYLASWHATMQLLREGKSFSGHERNCAYLNCGDQHFANVSAISGLDAPDDGRAVATVDWDHDGDLDLWFHNRTGPRLRFMRNNTADDDHEGGNFLLLKLQGSQSNRDAIGARVEVRLANSQAPPLLRTLYAGDGYLSQSSKWLHFGLGDGQQVESVHVRWPNGRRQTFRQVHSGGRYLLSEGLPDAKQRPPRSGQLSLAPHQAPPPPESAIVRSFLATPIPLPRLTQGSAHGVGDQPITWPGRPVLVTFWASWCGSCLEELSVLTAHEQQLRAAQLDVLALEVDSLAQSPTPDRESAEHLLQRLQFPFARGVATEETLSKLQILQRIVLNQVRPFVVPFSILVDSQGKLAAIYRGPVPVPTLLDDVGHLDASAVERRQAAIPFAGRWMSPPATLLLRPVAQVFLEAGYQDDYQRYLELDRQELAARRQTAKDDDQRREIDRQYASATFNLARTRQLEGQVADAIAYYRQGLDVLPDSATAHWYLGKALAEQGDLSAAIEQLRQAQQLDPSLIEASVDRARWLKSLGDVAGSLAELAGALQKEPELAAARFELGITLAEAGRNPEAILAFQRLVEQVPTDANAWANLGTLCAKAGRFSEALPALQRAVQLAPENVSAQQSLAGTLAATGDLEGAAMSFRRLTELRPQLPAAHAGLAQVLFQLHDWGPAAEAFERSLRLNPRDGGSMLRLAWIRAVCPDQSVRNGKQAVELAERLATATDGRDPQVLDTLAAAYAEQGRFAEALRTIDQAIALLNLDNQSQRMTLHARRTLYQASQPYRETQP